MGTLLCSAVPHAARCSTVWTALTLTPFPPGALDLGLLSRRLCPGSPLELWACGRVWARPRMSADLPGARLCSPTPAHGPPGSPQAAAARRPDRNGRRCRSERDEDAFTEALLVGTAAGGLLAAHGAGKQRTSFWAGKNPRPGAWLGLTEGAVSDHDHRAVLPCPLSSACTVSPSSPVPEGQMAARWQSRSPADEDPTK